MDTSSTGAARCAARGSSARRRCRARRGRSSDGLADAPQNSRSPGWSSASEIGVDCCVLRHRVVRQRLPAGLPGAHRQAGAVPRVRAGGAPAVRLAELGAGEGDRGRGAAASGGGGVGGAGGAAGSAASVRGRRRGAGSSRARSASGAAVGVGCRGRRGCRGAARSRAGAGLRRWGCSCGCSLLLGRLLRPRPRRPPRPAGLERGLALLGEPDADVLRARASWPISAILLGRVRLSASAAAAASASRAASRRVLAFCGRGARRRRAPRRPGRRRRSASGGGGAVARRTGR